MCLSDEGASDTKSEILLSAAMELLPLIMSKYYWHSEHATRLNPLTPKSRMRVGGNRKMFWEKSAKRTFPLTACFPSFRIKLIRTFSPTVSGVLDQERSRQAGSLLTYPIKLRLTLLTLQIALIHFKACRYQVSSLPYRLPPSLACLSIEIQYKVFLKFIISSSEKNFLLELRNKLSFENFREQPRSLPNIPQRDSLRR